MLSWIKRHWILSIFLLVGGVPASLNYSGYCWAEKRWLSDEELMIKSVGDKSVMADGSVGSTRVFLKENPECCVFGNFDVTPFDKIIGLTYTFVSVQYKLSEAELKQSKIAWGSAEVHDYGENWFWVDSCGKILEDSIGMYHEKKHTRFNKVMENRNGL